ncbi:hypothetical protein AC249_AIPGENE12400 [Exaiptasia diaphana]|nr:hypothetical protein AC249_AIPGENE12400 [Exaiptasia diaphana]
MITAASSGSQAESQVGSPSTTNLSSTAFSRPSSSSTSTATSATTVRAEHNRIFGYRPPSANSRQNIGTRSRPKPYNRQSNFTRTTTWSRAFICMANADQDQITTTTEKIQLTATETPKEEQCPKVKCLSCNADIELTSLRTHHNACVDLQAQKRIMFQKAKAPTIFGFMQATVVENYYSVFDALFIKVQFCNLSDCIKFATLFLFRKETSEDKLSQMMTDLSTAICPTCYVAHSQNQRVMFSGHDAIEECAKDVEKLSLDEPSSIERKCKAKATALVNDQIVDDIQSPLPAFPDTPRSVWTPGCMEDFSNEEEEDSDFQVVINCSEERAIRHPTTPIDAPGYPLMGIEIEKCTSVPIDTSEKCVNYSKLLHVTYQESNQLQCECPKWKCECPKWYALTYPSLTASKFGDICKEMDCRNKPKLLADKLLQPNPSTFFVDRMLKWGRENEDVAVQGQMGITGAKWCDFIVYTTQGISVQRIEYDSDFWKAEPKKLDEFYFSHFLPKYIMLQESV